MKSPITKIAAAVVVISGVLIAMHFVDLSTTTVTFADVIKPILNAQTAELDIIVGEEGEGPVIHDQIKGSRIRRKMVDIENISIIDLEASRVLSLIPSNKIAVYIDLKNLPQYPNYLERLRNLVSQLEQDPNFEVEQLGQREVDGQQAIGFLAKSSRTEVEIWADSRTALPIRIGQRQPNLKIIFKNIEFDVQIDEALFSTEIPEGYTQLQNQIDLTGSTEEDFIEGLRMLAQADGVFPEDVSVEYYLKNTFTIGQKIEALAKDDAQAIELGMKLGRHMAFLRFFKGEGKWHYAGNGVELGDAQTPIFWYRPEDSETWRVIYGDLHVEDAAEEDLPKSVLSDKQTKIIRSSEQWAKQEFVGTEKDVWHITASGNIVAHSDITLTKMPQNPSVMYVKLPYSSAVLESVMLDGKEVPFSGVTKDRYELELPVENLLERFAPIECIWSMPLEALVKVDYGYRIRLQGLIPVEGFVLTAVLEPDCGFEYSKDPSQTQITLFKTNKLLSMMDNASCGLSIQKSD